MISPLIIETLKNPISSPFLIVTQFILIILVIYKVSKESVSSFIEKTRTMTKAEKKKSLYFAIFSVLIFLGTIVFHFYKMTEVPPSGHEDDAKIVISAYILKNTGHDSAGKVIPYYPDLRIFYHKQDIGGEGQRGMPIYIQAFIQHFIKGGHFSFRVESSLITLFTGIIITCLVVFLTNNPITSLLFGSFFLTLPWTRTFARITTETTSYCFASACFLLSLFYLTKDKKFLGILFYLISLAILCFSYTAGLLLAPLCAIFIPLVLRFHSPEYKTLGNKLLILGIAFLGILYFNFREDGGYKSSIVRAQNAQGMEGIANFDFVKLGSTAMKNASTYTANYSSYFLPSFLFLVGDGNLRHNTGFGGQLFVTLFIAFYVGLFYLIKKRKEGLIFKLLLALLLISPIPASISLEGSLDAITRLPLHALRTGCMLPPIAIILFLGLVQIFKRSKVLFFIYLVAININMYYFYVDYFYNYPRRLGNSWICDPGLPKVSQEALKIIKEHPEKKLFYHCSTLSIAYNNLDTIGVDDLIQGTGLLLNVYNYPDFRDKEPPQMGDLFVVQEPFDYMSLNKKINFILRIRNPYLINHSYGASLFEIAE